MAIPLLYVASHVLMSFTLIKHSSKREIVLSWFAMWNGRKLLVSLITEFCPWIKLFCNSSAHAVVRPWLSHFFPLSLHGFHTEAKQAQAQAKHKYFNPSETYFTTFAVAFISVTQHSHTSVCAAFFRLVLLLAWISSDYFESLLLPQLLRGENDSKQSDEFQVSCWLNPD